jgi:hypothetical protein
MEQFEKRRFKEFENARAKYVAETKVEGFLPLKWWRQLRTPQLRHSTWQKINFFGKLEKLLAAPIIEWSAVAAELNLCALNAAIEITRLDAREMTENAEQIRQLSERARAVNK